MRPPREEGWFAEDLDRLPEAPRHTELIDGALVFMMSPQRAWHGRLVTALTTELMAVAPAGLEVEREMTIRLDDRNRPEPALLVTTAPYDPDRTCFRPEEVRLVVEVASPESAHRDRTVKLRKYAEAGIPRTDWRLRPRRHLPGRPATAGALRDRPRPRQARPAAQQRLNPAHSSSTSSMRVRREGRPPTEDIVYTWNTRYA
ncbi:hypothetical protein B446_23685 [Streptomyces collinus Tu 365]|uniref:Putative restriction endonuclease domain-containing protein n=1 Tax=Streptomyces collinus (strain DSM 40733 / Tue 365) TaxID=1214242 RepID=S5V8T1_STRC3|nr:hypothetical protein B446_23685 [Streptomyces collinus Tu 365]